MLENCLFSCTNGISAISHSRNRKYKRNGYKLLVQRFLVTFRCTSFYLWLANSCLEYHRPIITNACPSKRSQKSLHLKLVPILTRVSEAGICTPMLRTRQSQLLLNGFFRYHHSCLSTIYHEKISSSLVFFTATSTFMDFKNRRLLSGQPCSRTIREKSSVLMRLISHPGLKWVKKKTVIIMSLLDISNKFLAAK